MSQFNFKSAICTNRQQSERLLSLGLKKETADMHWAYHSVTATRYMVAHPCDGVGECIPAWSLHRMIEMMPESIHLDNFADTHYYRTFLPSKIIYMKYDHTWIWLSDKQNDYDKCVDTIEWLIKEGYFNKEYLEE